ncbi:MAG: ATP-grasp domain-containing protein [Candidatus Zixiibacteriota bacterium]
MRERRVLVVGTTPDYIAYIDKRYSGQALFLTDTAQRVGAAETAPGKESEIVCDLLDKEEVFENLQKHLEKFNQSLSGVTCYDCEWLVLAAELAARFDLPYSPAAAVRAARDKYLSKKTWGENGVRCPRVELLGTSRQAVGLHGRFEGPVVLKPLTGSGSELTFVCYDAQSMMSAVRMIREGLAQRSNLPMYRLDRGEAAGEPEPDYPVLAEEMIAGREYSADFIIEDDRVNIIRVAKKLGEDTLPFGTTRAYEVPAELPSGMDYLMLANRLYEAAQALGFKRAVCMVDFIVSKDEIVFLELTPRIGGDCLPPLVRQCCGLDTIGLALDFAEGKKIEIPSVESWRKHVGLRLFATSGGILSAINCEDAGGDARVKEIYLKRSPGHVIVLPPEDYDSWFLGHVIFEPEPDTGLKAQGDDILKKIKIEVEKRHDRKNTGFFKAGDRAVSSENRSA